MAVTAIYTAILIGCGRAVAVLLGQLSVLHVILLSLYFLGPKGSTAYSHVFSGPIFSH